MAHHLENELAEKFYADLAELGCFPNNEIYRSLDGLMFYGQHNDALKAREAGYIVQDLGNHLYSVWYSPPSTYKFLSLVS